MNEKGPGMSRPKITLQEWLNSEQNKKIEFIKKECDQNSINGLLTFTSVDTPPSTYKITYKNNFNNNVSHFVLGKLHFEVNNHKIIFDLSLTEEQYNQLRAKYRVYKKNLHDSALVKKQYKFSKQTSHNIQKLKNEWSVHREEQVIENLINSHLNKQEEKKTLVKLNLKLSRFNILTQDNDKLSQEIYVKNTHIKTLKTQLKEMEELLAKSYLKSDHYKEILKTHGIKTETPKTTDHIIRKKVLEIQEILKASL